jgi:hypothetical protein
MEIEVKDLEIGDEILIPSNSSLIYAKVLKLPKVRTTPKRWHATNIVYYKSVKCSINYRDITQTRTYMNSSGVSQVHNWNRKKYMCTPLEHNVEKFFDLNEKSLWLINRKSF